MLTYVCSLPNKKKAGRVRCLISDNPAAIEQFAQTWDKPAYGIFECVSPLVTGATRRTLDTVQGLVRIHVDVDTYKLTDAKEDVLHKLRRLPLRAQLRDSGGGYHVVWHLKELVPRDTAEFDRLNKIRTELTQILCGDKSPDHAAALLRRVGTHNSKHNGEPRLVRIVQDAVPVTILELEELVDLLGDAPLFTPKLPKANGHDHAQGA